MKTRILSIVVLLVFTHASLFGWQAEDKTYAVRKPSEQAVKADKMPNLSGDAAKEYLKKEGLYDSLVKSVRAQKESPDTPEAAFSQVRKITASDGESNDSFGYSISISGDTAIVSAAGDSFGGGTQQGSAYIFERNAGGANNWSQVRKLTASDAANYDQFGSSVAIWGNTAIVGAPKETVFSNAAGAVYVFERNAGGANNWGQVKKITPNDGAIGDYFGHSVAIGGDTIIAGASGDDIGSNADQGSVYVFERNTGGTNNWGHVKKIEAADGMAEARLGWAAALGGDTAIVGTLGAGAYIFERDAGGADNWGQVKKLTASDGAGGAYGESVAIDGNTAIVGASFRIINNQLTRGAAYIFERNAGGADNWGAVKLITAADGTDFDSFGISVAISKDKAVVGAYEADIGSNFNQGAAYVFEKNAGGANNWGQVKKLQAADGAADDTFGWRVVIEGKTIIVSARLDQIGENPNQGSAYIFNSQNDTWVQDSKPLPASCTVDDWFGWSVAVSGDTAIVGAPQADVNANANEGAAYIFYRNQGGANNWGLVKTLVAPYGGAARDGFGWSVAVSGDRAIVGAPYRDVAGNANSGEIFIFERNAGGANNWGFIFTAGSVQPNALYGISVAIDGGTAIAGVSSHDFSGNVNRGLAAIFQYSQNQFNHVKNILATDGVDGDFFGQSVAVSGDTIIVGAHFDNVGANADQGSAYVFERNAGGANNWGEVKKLTASDGAAQDLFGISVDVSGDTIAVGSYLDDDAGITDRGAAYVFERNAGGANNWGQVKKLQAADGATVDQFGVSVSVSGDLLSVGSWFDQIGANRSQGSAYIFRQNAGGANNWGQIKKLTASDGTSSDIFGKSVALDAGNTLLVGAPGDKIGGIVSPGSSYVFTDTGADWVEQAKPLPPLPTNCGANDQYGYAVAIEGDTAVITAPTDDIGTSADQGSAYILSRNEGGSNNWGLVKVLTAWDGAAGDRFGRAVAISGDKIIVGAPLADIDANQNQGAAYLFERNLGGTDNWGAVKKLTAADGAAQDEFGAALDISGNTIIVGEYKDQSNKGAAYIYEKNAGGAGNWGQTKKLTAGGNPLLFPWFGYSTAIDGDLIVVGVVADYNEQTQLTQGAAYVFERGAGGANNWGLVKKLIASDGAEFDSFGNAVAINERVVIVGANAADVGTNADQGAAYIFAANAGGANNWGQVRKITVADGAAADSFGSSVSISGDAAIVGVPSDDIGANENQGSAYIFEQNAGGADNWGQVKKLTDSNGGANYRFGNAVAADGDIFLVGAFQATVEQSLVENKSQSNLFPPVQQGVSLVFRGAALAPTAASVSVEGRVETADGRGIPNAVVRMTNARGETRTVRTGSFGNYRFTEVPTGETYVFTVVAGRYSFNQNTRVQMILEDTPGINFVADKF